VAVVRPHANARSPATTFGGALQRDLCADARPHARTPVTNAKDEHIVFFDIMKANDYDDSSVPTGHGDADGLVAASTPAASLVPRSLYTFVYRLPTAVCS
jgi:hypothetical protein